MATNYGKTCENENYGGMCRIYVDLYRDLLWAVFIDKVPIPVLVRELAKILQNARTFKCFHHQFKRLLKVYASTGTIKNTDCDISVIYSLFRNIPTTLVPPTQGWGNIPQPGHFLVTDDLERIHHGRNELIGHAGEASITDADFTAQLSDIKNIVTRLDGSYLLHLQQIESDCQSSKGHLNHYDEYIKELKRQQDAETDLRAKFDEHNTKFDEHDTRLGGHDTKFEEHDTTFDEHDTRLGGHDTKFEEHGTRLGGHDTKFDEHDTRLGGHDTKCDEYGTRLGGHDTKFDEHDTKFDEHDTRVDEHDTRLGGHDTKFDEHGTRLGGHDTKFDEHDTKFDEHDTRVDEHDARLGGHDIKIDEHDTKFDEHDTRLGENDTKFDELDTRVDEHDARLGGHDTKCDEHDTRLEGHDTKFDEHDTKLEEHDAKFGNLETKMEEQEQIYSRVKRKQEEESQEKQKRAKVLSAGQNTLKNDLLELYRDKILLEEPNVWFSMKDVLQMVVPLDIREDLERWMTLSRADRKKEITSKARRGTKIKSKREMFFKGSERQYEIYLLGEAGVGKSTFCHQLIDNWCRVQDTESNDDYLCELKSFPFLFFIQARHAKKSQSVYEMIQTQNCPLKFRSILEEVFTSHPENCLVLIDGLDEWQSGTRGYQELPSVTEIKGSTILITSRQWRIEALDRVLPSSCRVLEIQGLDSYGIENLAVKVFEVFTREDNPGADCKPLVDQFMNKLNLLKLRSFAQIPFLLIILIKSWLIGNRNLENARGFIYSGLIESLLVHSGKKVEYTGTRGDSTNTPALPSCFKKKEHCQSHSSLIHELSKLAFNMLFSDEKENSLVFRKQDLDQQLGIKEHLTLCLKLGLLTETKGLSETKECHRSFSFPHKSIQEFFSSVYLSGEEFNETGFAKFRERVTSPNEVYAVENDLLFLAGMNNTHCKTLFDYSCGIVFCRKYAHEKLYPVEYPLINVQKIEKLGEQCTAEARHSVPEGSHTVESLFVIPDMVVYKDTPEHKVGQFCRQGLNIKSLVYECDYKTTTVTPFSVVESIRTMQHIQRLGIGCTAENTEKYIVCICTHLSNLHQLKSFSFSVEGNSPVSLPIHVCTELVSKLDTLPNLVSVYLKRIDLSDINTCKFTSQLTSLGLDRTKSLSPGVMSGWCNQLHTLYMQFVNLSPAAVHKLRQYLMTSSSLQYLELCLPYIYTPSPYYVTVFDDVLDLTSQTLLHTLRLWFIDLKSGVRIHPGHNWREIHMGHVSMSESMWQEFIHHLPTKPLQQLDVWLYVVKSLNTQTLSYIRDKFCVTEESTDSDRRTIRFNTKH